MTDFKKWVVNGIDKEMTIEADRLAKKLAKPRYEKTRQGNDKKIKALSTSQLRKFFGEIKRIQAVGITKDSVSDIIMLKPKLAYAVGRDKNESQIGDFYSVIAPCLDAIDTDNEPLTSFHFKNFVQIFEAIVAYHKAAGGE